MGETSRHLTSTSPSLSNSQGPRLKVGKPSSLLRLSWKQDGGLKSVGGRSKLSIWGRWWKRPRRSPPLDIPTVERRHNFSPNQLFHNRSGFPSDGKCAPPLSWQPSQCPARNESRVSSCDKLDPAVAPNHLAQAQACRTGRRQKCCLETVKQAPITMVSNKD